MKDMCEFNEKEIDQDYVDVEDGYNSEEIMGQIAVQKELKRIDIQENPVSKTSKETKASDFYKESIIKVETIGEMFQKLLGYGLDYNNALSFASIILQGDTALKQQKYGQAFQEQNQI